MSLTAQDIVSTAQSYLETPFQHAGRQKGLGVDCVGLLVCVGHELGLMPLDSGRYSRFIQTSQLESAIAPFCDRIINGPIETADVLLFWIEGVRQHTGLAIRPDAFIHAWETVGKVVESPLPGFWSSRLAAVYRLKESLWQPSF